MTQSIQPRITLSEKPRGRMVVETLFRERSTFCRSHACRQIRQARNKRNRLLREVNYQGLLAEAAGGRLISARARTFPPASRPRGPQKARAPVYYDGCDGVHTADR